MHVSRTTKGAQNRYCWPHMQSNSGATVMSRHTASLWRQAVKGRHTWKPTC